MMMKTGIPTALWLLLVALSMRETQSFSPKISAWRKKLWPSLTGKHSLGADPEVTMNATELITSKGFPVENHWVTTEDGYILNLIRIPHGRNKTGRNGPQPVVFLQHGFTGSCTNFLTNLVNQSLAYILADAGADVWLGNSRGNYYSLNHTSLDPKSIQFWQFSWDQMAKYDLPVSINYAMKTSGASQIFYVGHSQGTTIGFAAFSENPQLASQIKQFIALAPVAKLAHTESPLKFIAPLAEDEKIFYGLFGDKSFGISESLARLLAQDLCRSWGEYLCASVQFLFSGFDFKSLNVSRIPVYIGHEYDGLTSSTDMLHWAQLIDSKNFQHFDYGSAEANMKHYGQKTPPLYNPKNVTVPVAAFHGGKDWLADPDDVSWLLPQLNVTHDVFVPHYAHLDFIIGTDAPTLIYQDVLKIIFS